MAVPALRTARAVLAAMMCVAAVVAVVALLSDSSGLARASSLLLGCVLVAWFANELRVTTSVGQRQVLRIGLMAGAVVLAIAVFSVTG